MDYGSYVDLAALKSHMGISDTTDDTTLLAKIEAASRFIDGPHGCNRHFYAKTATRTFTASLYNKLLLPYDLLSITTLKHDEDGDWDYDYTWATTDYHLSPFNEFPKTKILTKSGGNYSFPTSQEEGVQIAGLWGYGTGDTATPYTALATTATVATTTGTTLTTSAATGLAIGQTILVESEQMYITAGSSTSWTVVRGVNGTTAAAHSAKAISVYQYPKEITEACTLLAVKLAKLAETPFGINSAPEMGNTYVGRLVDVRINELLSQHRKIVVV